LHNSLLSDQSHTISSLSEERFSGEWAASSPKEI
jgi:hypothetical protein